MSSSQKTRGFTLIEMLVVAPLVILLIGSIISVISTLTGDSLKVLTRNEKIHEVQDTLETIEANSTRAMEGFTATTTGALPSPQGPNSSAGTFTSNATTLVIKQPATNTNPLSSSRRIVYSDSACTTVYPVYLVYFLSEGTLYERTVRSAGTTNGYYLNGSGSCVTATPWQRGSCKSGDSGTVCQKIDEALATDITSFSVTYPNDLSAKLTLASSKTVAGQAQSYTSSLTITAPQS